MGQVIGFDSARFLGLIVRTVGDVILFMVLASLGLVSVPRLSQAVRGSSCVGLLGSSLLEHPYHLGV